MDRQQGHPPYHHRERDGLTNVKDKKMEAKYIISAHNDQGAYCAGGAAASLTAAVKKARAKFGRGWKIEIWLEVLIPDLMGLF